MEVNMDTRKDQYVHFFLKPAMPKQRQYEVLRAYYLEKRTAGQIAEQFGITDSTIYGLVGRFKGAVDSGSPIAFFIDSKTGPKKEREKAVVREKVILLRAQGYADTDIHKALKKAQIKASVALIDQIIRDEGLGSIRKRTQQDREQVKAQIDSGHIPGLDLSDKVVAELPVQADVNELDLGEEQILFARVAGIFLFIPFLVELGLHTVVQNAEMIGTKMIPAISYVLSLLALKLLDKERKSHISDWNFDEVLGLFAGLNILPKTTAASDYTYRLVNGQHNQLLAEWVRAVYPILCPQPAGEFALDFHTIHHRGQDTGMENHYVPSIGKAARSIQVCFARSTDQPMLCYAKADITKDQQAQMPLEFVEYWQGITGIKPNWLYLDSKMTTYGVLDQLRAKDIFFVTIRRRGTALLHKIYSHPPRDWTSAVIDTPQRRHQTIRYLDERVKLGDYSGLCRQVTTTGFGRTSPTLFLTNNETVGGKEVITRYLHRNSIENEIGINVNFFHMDCLSSEVRLNVETDVVMTVIANGCYRWLSKQLKGCEKMEPKQLYRKFIETGGHVRARGNDLIVSFERRSHNPIIAQALRGKKPVEIPWLKNKKLRFEFK
jgi:hypothetical protein